MSLVPDIIILLMTYLPSHTFAYDSIAECEAADVTFKEVFALSKKFDFVAREFYLTAGSTWKYRLKEHANAPVRRPYFPVLVLDRWDDCDFAQLTG